MNYNDLFSALSMNVVQSEYATELVPTKRHIKKDWMSDNYHKRIQKKWTKRYGMKNIPSTYFHHKHGLVVHPTIFAVIKSVNL